MLKRDSLLFHLYSKDIRNRRIDVQNSGMGYDAVLKNDSPLIVRTFNLVGFLVFYLFLLLPA